MHVLIVTPGHFMTPSLPTSSLFQIHQAIALSKAGCKVGILSAAYIPIRYMLSKYPYIKQEIQEGIPILRNHPRTLFPRQFKPYRARIQDYQNLGEALYQDYESQFGRPDVIHAHNFEYGGLIAQIIKYNHGIPFILTEHSSKHLRGLYKKRNYISLRRCIQDSGATTAVSTLFSLMLQEKTNEPISVLPNVIDINFEKNICLNKKNHEFTFLNIATLDNNKDHRNLLLAFSQLPYNSKVKLRIGGVGKLLSNLKYFTKELNIEDRVTFIGALSRSQVIKEMNDANCFVLPSKVETFGVVLIEAIACGTPVVATICGGPEDIINNSNGILVEKENASELSNAMQYIYENQKEYNNVCMQADILRKFGSEAFSQQAIRLYEHAINAN